ncbi:MAG: Raf kinase inhibitor-like YbhB/YbcL family protein [Cellvibrionaceae bacterium]|jgi:Raf kinase inhibitor-like YbhB/YbcL family protein
MQNIFTFFSALSLIVSAPLLAGSLTLSSNDIEHAKFMDKKQEFNGFGCSGEDLSPHLQWSNAPKGTKSFAVTAYDPDAPTGSGWWHWQIINIPTNVTELPNNAGSAKENLSPPGSTQIKNDYGSRGFGGACPPEGHGVHHYRFTVHALSIEKIELPEDASGALAGYIINANTIESTTIESLYKRD